MSEAKRKRKPYSEISDEEKEYRRQWEKENRAKISINVNKSIKDEFSEACKKMKRTQYSIIKTTIDETIAKANQHEEE